MVFYLQKILDEGTSNPIVARIGSQLSDLVALCQIDKKKKDDLSCIFNEIMSEILAAHKQATPLIEELQIINENPSKHGLILETHKRAIPSSMKLDTIRIFLKHANGALRLLAQALAVFFDQGWMDAKFDNILEFIAKKQNRSNKSQLLIDLIKDNLDLFADIIDLRNVDEHKYYKRQKKQPLVKNYELSSKEDQFFLVPPKLCNGKEVLTFLLDARQRIFLACEEIIVATIILFLHEPITICEIPEEERKKNFPKRFEHCLTLHGEYALKAARERINV